MSDINEAAIRTHLTAAREILVDPHLVHGPARTALEQLIEDIEALLDERRGRRRPAPPR